MQKKTYLYCCVFNYLATGEGYDYFAALLYGESEQEVRRKFHDLYCNNKKEYKPTLNWFNLGVNVLAVKEIISKDDHPMNEINMLVSRKGFLEKSLLKAELSERQINRLYGLIKNGGIVGGDFVYKIYYNLA